MSQSPEIHGAVLGFVSQGSLSTGGLYTVYPILEVSGLKPILGPIAFEPETSTTGYLGPFKRKLAFGGRFEKCSGSKS